jgi:uncharacterized protein (UPF0248 family)
MRTSHALLLRLRHDPQFDFSKAEVEFVDRGAPGDRSVVQGDKIVRLEQGWMEIEWENMAKSIPFHRIRRITYEGTIMWEKSDEPKSMAENPDDEGLKEKPRIHDRRKNNVLI